MTEPTALPAHCGPTSARLQPSFRHGLGRAATRDKIKQAALRLMVDQGLFGVTFAGIAREMGVTASALYRYFASRDELMAALATDAHDELCAVVAGAREGVLHGDVWARINAEANALRSWATRYPVRYALAIGMPPGYVPNGDGFVYDTAASVPAHVLPAVLYRWAFLYGFISLEAQGHLSCLPPGARDALFLANLQYAARDEGRPRGGQPARYSSVPTYHGAASVPEFAADPNPNGA